MVRQVMQALSMQHSKIQHLKPITRKLTSQFLILKKMSFRVDHPLSSSSPQPVARPATTTTQQKQPENL